MIKRNFLKDFNEYKAKIAILTYKSVTNIHEDLIIKFIVWLASYLITQNL